MKPIFARVLCLHALCGVLAFSTGVLKAQVESSDAISGAEIPRLIPFSGTATDAAGEPATGALEITFALYKEQQGGPQLWTEMQKVNPDQDGHYSVLLGAASANGVPQDAFNSTEARWLGVDVDGVEQPRVMLLSVPYALKAGDAETLGGLPASAYMRTSSSNATTSSGSYPAQVTPLAQTLRPSTALTIGGQGTQGYLPIWTGTQTLDNSVAYQSGNNLGVGKTVLEGDGISAVNVKAFGAQGDGVTDDTAAIAAAIGAIPTTGGQLFFPPGKYITSGGFNLLYPTDIVGVGQASRDLSQYGTMIVNTSPTSSLFTVTAKVASFRNLALVNKSTSAPTAGAAIFTNSADSLQRVNFDLISVSGFYDDLHVGVGSSWTLRASHIQNPVRYGLYIQNTVNPDDGDWIVTDNYFEGGALTSLASSAAINIESSGGGKVSNNKINATYANGIRINASGSSQTLIDHNDIENVTGPPINIIQGWPYITIIGNFLNASGGLPCIAANGLDGFFIGSNLLETRSGTSVPNAITVTASQYGTIGPNVYNNHFTAPTSITGSYNITDMSSTATGGLTPLRPRRLDESVPGTLALDDGTGNISMPAGKTYQINGTSITALVGTTRSIGGKTLAAGHCSSGVVAVNHALSSMVVTTTPVTYPGDGMAWRGYVSAPGIVTVVVCAEVRELLKPARTT